MSEIEDIVNRYSKFVYSFDELDKITYEFHLEEIIKDIKNIGFVDVDNLWKLHHLGIRLVNYLMEYKNISEIEAVSLFKLEYVTYQNFIDIMNYTIENWVKKQ